ncbi:RNA polymerase II C-terminal domain phosphatase-like 3 [Cucurbita pepo subsp. pepo]|uniref:RNA polymerase II C-terminal domain phosphatase-like 3 n=1 Tax=Cucurbita pepo subsp. pepo TaxID=3664 RepID=UPI000C9D4C0F|nr:RNA polymerase II C-terminal domain phosphatase-like 3 [Cucurbita pepo subsp. pepo]
MGKHTNCVKTQDVEEGEISDTPSVEEITEEDFNKLETAPKLLPSKHSNRETTVWTMSDLYNNYPTMCRGYASGLYNLAWAKAVQNKPLNEIFLMDADPDDKSNRSSSSPFRNAKEHGNGTKQEAKLIIDITGDDMNSDNADVEKEEGELEEGEIDMDTEFVEEVVDSKPMLSDSLDTDYQEIDLKNKELDDQLKLIHKTLDAVTIDAAQKSFHEVCSQLLSSIETFLELVQGKVVPRKDALIQRLYAALRIINSVFCSMNPKEKEECKPHLSRLLSFVKNCNTPLFSPEQIKSVEVKMPSTDSLDHFPHMRDSAKDVEIHIPNGVKNKDFYSAYATATPHLTSSTKLPSDSMPVGVTVKNNLNLSSDSLLSGVPNVKGRGPLLPLLDLHKDHDVDSLPSPTREAPTVFSVQKSGHIPVKVARAMDGSRVHPYETDAVKAVSTYQQKFGRSSFSMADRLPSPTPSEECDGGGDIGGEVSSSSIFRSSKASNSYKLAQTVSNSASSISTGLFPNLESSSTKGLISPLNVAPPSSVSNPIAKPLAKSRDPRLRMVTSEASAMDLNPRTMTSVQNPSVVESAVTVNMRKQKMDVEPNIDAPEMKRQRIGSQNHAFSASDLRAGSGSGGWLEDTMSAVPRLSSRNQMEIAEANATEKNNVTNNSGAGNSRGPTISASKEASLPSLLKDIVVNPTMLLSLLKMNQQKQVAAELKLNSSEPEKNAICPTAVNPCLGSSPLVNAPALTSGILQQSAGTPSVPSPPVVTVDDVGKVRMKPRDPRRILHGNSLHKVGSMGNEQLKSVVPAVPNPEGSRDIIPNGHKQEGQGNLRLASSQPLLPDIGRQFTNNLKNIADIMSVPSPPTSSHNSSSKPVKLDRKDTNAVGSSSIDSKIVATATQAVDMVGPSRSHGAWGDLEHLFEGYDDKQKAAIQRERARRIDEQKKMFAARKLCLVLDLDHTLLNSAKFVEVDPVHDEILRKKEEQDREKAQRHLFRFPHMGMWTKLRPGVWNFLEKASELYELHLYTMGNKLYATEMAKVLDPKGVLFAGRVLSRGDDGDPLDGEERVPKSKDLEGVLGMESAVVIIDDSIRVWPHNKMNLIVVERYTYFPCSRRQFGLLGPSLLEIDHDERPEDGTLASSLAVIQRIHQTFFSHPVLDEVDVRNILASEQQRILAGCRIVFSRVFPVGEANPHLHPLWQTAEQFGAVCTNQIDEQVTHVVANSLGTDKVNWALSTGRFVVHPGWVEASALLYRRANEQDFAIKP